ncbi:MAG: aminodeoxychorismate/anthranilate synthase component II [Flavobacteriales bacterium]|nr:aminodeoxychorismate/anthranilate synthase component II [Flavobacteriales bacterium]
MSNTLVMIDNYDSFTYNLVHYIEMYWDGELAVMKNDAIDWDVLEQCFGIILSPGPGLPNESGMLMKAINQYFYQKPILGVCLGQQALAEATGAQLKNLSNVYHGVATPIKLMNIKHPLFKDLPPTISVGRYHSWVIDQSTLGNMWEISAIDENNEIMAIQHKTYPVCAVQFHPESVLTPNGKKMIENWINSLYKHP